MLLGLHDRTIAPLSLRANIEALAEGLTTVVGRALLDQLTPAGSSEMLEWNSARDDAVDFLAQIMFRAYRMTTAAVS